MKKQIFTIAIVVLALAAQASAQKADHKWEVYGGYLNGQNRYSTGEDDVTFGGATQNIPLCTPSADSIF